MAVIGLDVGTTNCKCGVYNNQGALIKIFSKEYDVVRKANAQYIDSKMLYASVLEILQQASKEDDIEAICISSLGESFVPVGKDYTILADSMLYTDVRGKAQAEYILSQMSDDELFMTVGTKAHSMYSLPKMMWLKQHQPETYLKADKLLLIGDFIGYMLTGEALIDYSLAARTMALDVVQKKYYAKLLNLAEISETKLSTPVKSGTIAGKLRKEIAEQLQMKNCVVIVGAHDQVCSAVGAGVLTPGESVNGMGTVECITPLFDRPQLKKEMGEYGFSCVPYVIDGTYVTYMFNYCGGALLKWYKDCIHRDLANKLKHQNESFYNHFNQRMPKDPTNLLILPHFAGAATPYMDAEAMGAIVNLTLSTSAEEIYRGLMESTAYEMRLNAEKAREFNIFARQLTVTGGGTNSDEWLQIKADIMGVPIFPLQTSEAGINGTAMLALTALGHFKNLQEAASVMVQRREPFYPRLKNAAVYDNQYEKYKKLYQSLKEIR